MFPTLQGQLLDTSGVVARGDDGNKQRDDRELCSFN